MTVPISDRLSQLYVGNGTNTRFDFTFRVFNQEDSTGIAIRKKGTIEFETVDPSTYAVTINQDGFGGYVVFNTPPSSSVYFYIAGATPLDQLLDITNYDNFYPDAIERALDKLTALLQEWGTQLDLEKQARILADIHYDSLAMEREENLENRLISYVNAIIGITNPKVFDGISDRMVITEDGRTQREFNQSVPFWTEDYSSFKQATILRESKIIEYSDQKNTELGTILNESILDEKARAQSIEENLQLQISTSAASIKYFSTEVELLAFIPNVNDPKQAYAFDTKKNYLWQLKSGSTTLYEWKDEGLSALDLAKQDATVKANFAEANAIAYTELKTQGLLEIDLGDALFAKVDLENRPVEVTAPDGRHYLVGLPGSTQELILDNLERVETVEFKLPQFDYDELSLVAHDILGRVLFYMRNDNHLFLDHLSDSVQNSINANTSLLSDMTMSLSMTESSAIKSLTKGTFTADSAAILSMKVPATNSMNYIKMDSPYRKDDAFVHPCVIELYKPMRGFKYLMCITPYWGRNPYEENPTIYGSNDQITWTMLTGFAQPIANPPEIDEPETGEHGYLSDNWWAYDPINKELYCCYRKGYYANYPNGYSDNDRMQLLYRKTTNGLTWSKPTMFTPETLLGIDGQVAPSMIYDQVNKRWVLFYLKTNDSRIYVRFNSELKVDGWTAPQEIGFKAFADANNIKGWHIETKWVGNKLFMLIGDSTNGRYYFAVSNDDTFLNWTFSANSVLDSTWTKGAYKGSFLVVPQENGKIKLRMYFTDTGIGRFYSALSPDISIS